MRKKVSNRERINDICALNWSKTNRDFPKVVESPKNMPEGKGVEEFNAIRVTDANSMAPCDSVVSSVDFSQENVSLLLAAGLDRKLRIFDIDGKRNSLKSSTLFEDLPLHKAKFTSSGRVVLSGKANFVYVFDIID